MPTLAELKIENYRSPWECNYSFQWDQDRISCYEYLPHGSMSDNECLPAPVEMKISRQEWLSSHTAGLKK
jgi:hypothetical protein